IDDGLCLGHLRAALYSINRLDFRFVLHAGRLYRARFISACWIFSRVEATQMSPARKAVCLLSGGLDSSTCLALARRQGLTCYALSFDYGQRHRVELEAAARVAENLGTARHLVVHIDLRVFGGS